MSEAWQTWRMEPLGVTAPSVTQPQDGEREQQRQKAFERRLELQRLRERLQAEAEQVGHAEGREKGYAKGLAEGRETAAEELRQQVQQTLEPLRALCLNFDAALREVDGQLAAEVGRVALHLAGQLAGEALAVQPAQVEAQVRQMLACEPALSGKPRLDLHPDDLPWVESSLGEALEAAGWSLHADAQLLPGGCRVASASGELDATRQTREAMFQNNGQWLLDASS